MQKKPFSAILHMSPRERMVTLVWTSCVLSGLLLVSVLFFVRPFPMFSQDSVAVLDATVADMNTQDKGRFVRIQVVPNPSDAGASSFIVPASGTRFFVGQKVQVVVDSGRRFPEQKGHVWEVRNMRGDPLVDSHDIGLPICRKAEQGHSDRIHCCPVPLSAGDGPYVVSALREGRSREVREGRELPRGRQ